MKKYLSIVFVAVFALILTGCAKTVKCTKETTTEGYKFYFEIKSYVKAGKVYKVTYKSSVDYKDKDAAKQTYDAEKARFESEGEESVSLELDGTKVIYSDTETIEKDKRVTTDEMKKTYEEDGYTCK